MNKKNNKKNSAVGVSFYKRLIFSGTTSTENAESGTENTTASNNSTGSPQSANKDEKVNYCLH